MDTLPYELVHHIATKCNKSTQCTLQVVSKSIHYCTKDLVKCYNFIHHTQLAINDWTNCKNPPNKKKKKYYKVLDTSIQYSSVWLGVYLNYETMFVCKITELINCDWIPKSKKQKYIKQCENLNINMFLLKE